MFNRAVFIDRDGVVNRAITFEGRPFAPTSLDEFEILEGVPEGLALLRRNGFKTVLVTNQPDISTGKQTLSELNRIHNFLKEVCEIDLIEVCCHTDEDGCSCRKPKAGMLLSAARKLSIDLAKSYMIGDRWRDIEAGQNAGCAACFFIDYQYSERGPSGNYIKVQSLVESANIILGLKKRGENICE